MFSSGEDPYEALKALLLTTVAHPGSSWRVGVLNVTSGDKDEEASSSMDAKNVGTNEPKPAVLHVEALELETNDGATAAVCLWRPDMLTGVIEVGAQHPVMPVNSVVLIML